SHVPGRPENLAYLSLFFEGPLMAHIDVNWLSPVKVRQTLIGGSRKMIVYNDKEITEKGKGYDRGSTPHPPQNQKAHPVPVSYRTGDIWTPRLDTTEALRVEAEHLLDCIANGSRPFSDGRAGLEVVRILEAASRSMAEGGRPVDLAGAESQ